MLEEKDTFAAALKAVLEKKQLSQADSIPEEILKIFAK